MLEYFASILREYPTLALFLTIGLGFYVGKLRIGSFRLGSVTAVLLVAIVIGQLDIPVSGPIKQFFFMMFLFSIGYKVGPDFFKSLRGSGAKQALFAVCMSAVVALTTLTVAWLMGYDKGEATGFFSGSQTCSALIGVGSEAISKLGLPADETRSMLDLIPVCYSVTYIFGTLGTVIILGNFGPRLLGGLDHVKKKTAELESRLNKSSADSDPSMMHALHTVSYRAFLLTDPFFDKPRTTREVEERLSRLGGKVHIDTVLRHGETFIPRENDLLVRFDTIVVGGRSTAIVRVGDMLGPEEADTPALDYHVQRIPVVVARKSFIGRTWASLRTRKWFHGVVIRDARRNGKPIEINDDTVFAKGDKISLVGRPRYMDRALDHIGHADRPSIASDLMFVGLAIFIGGLFGALTLWVDSIPLSFGTSGGSLIAGLVFGWLRSKRPTYGNIAPGALWIMNNLGLNVFIAVIGLEAAPSFVSGIIEVGPMLFVAGIVATTIPVLTGLWLGNKVFRFNPAITLGCVAGTRTSTASLGAVQSTLGSSIPAIGYTVTYAVANILLVIWGLVTVLLI